MNSKLKIPSFDQHFSLPWQFNRDFLSLNSIDVFFFPMKIYFVQNDGKYDMKSIFFGKIFSMENDFLGKPFSFYPNTALMKFFLGCGYADATAEWRTSVSEKGEGEYSGVCTINDDFFLLSVTYKKHYFHGHRSNRLPKIIGSTSSLLGVESNGLDLRFEVLIST